MSWLKKYACCLYAFWLMVFVCALFSGSVAHRHGEFSLKTSKTHAADSHGKVISEKADDCLFCHGFHHFSGEVSSAETCILPALPPQFGSVIFYAVFGYSELPSMLSLRGPPAV